MYSVHWADVAEYDLVEIVDYIAEDDLATAGRVFNDIVENAETLRHTPAKFRVVPELLAQGITTYRELIVRPSDHL